MTTQMKETQLLSLSVIAKCFNRLLVCFQWWHLFSADAIGLTKLKTKIESQTVMQRRRLWLWKINSDSKFSEANNQQGRFAVESELSCPLTIYSLQGIFYSSL